MLTISPLSSARFGGRSAAARRSAGLLLLLLTGTGCQPATDGPSGGAANEKDAATSASAGPTSTGTTAVTSPTERVLRHAVFFQFKEDASEEDVAGVVAAFQALPTKIEAIQGFEWGTNNSPEGLDDGFTHCFLLTFADDPGRAAYLPHPEHKAFGNVLRPHLERVFVIDYWGTPSDVKPPRALRHAVFFKFKDDAAADDIRAVEEAFAALPAKIEAVKGFEWGTNNSPEGLNDGFTHCFLVTFDSEAGRDAYLPHAEHQAFVEVLKPVLDKVRVLDFWAEP